MKKGKLISPPIPPFAFFPNAKWQLKFINCAILFFVFFLTKYGSSQISLDNNYFPLPGSEYNRFICVNATVGSPGAAQQYDFSNAMVWLNDTLRYIDPAVTGFASFHPGSAIATVQWADISIIWYYSADANAYWTSGGTLIGDFGQGMTAVHANHPAPYVDTLISNEYSYGHIETEISGIRFQNLSPGLDYQTISGKYISVDGWGSLFAPLDTFNNVLRVKYVEFKYDTVFSNNVPVDAKSDTLYYYKYFAEGKRHPVVIAHTDTFDNIQWMEIIHFPDTLFGCTDTAAENFNPLATKNNGSCLYCNQVNYTISPDANICTGDSVTLFATGGTNYLWSTGDSVASIVVSPDSSQTYSVYLSNQSYCWEVASVEVSVYEDVQAAFWPTATSADSILFVNTSTNASNYLWNFGDSTTSTEKNPKHLFTTEGIKNVMLIASNQCSSDTFYLSLAIVGKDEFELPHFSFQVYPNPGLGWFQISLNGHKPKDENQKIKIYIYNLLGEEILHMEYNPKNPIVNLSQNPDGIYYVHLISGKHILRQKIVKMQ